MILLHLTANTGPEECCLAVRKALCRLQNEACSLQLRVELLEQVPSAIAGNFHSVLLALDGEQASALAERWRGSVLWTCPSPYRPGHRRKNWFIGVEVFEAEASSPAGQALRDQDLRFETLRAGGPGGQHVNKTDSAVRATHLPTGLSVRVETERSQHANKRLARALLAHKLSEQARRAQGEARQQRWRQHYEVQRGNAALVFKGEGFEEG
ncbi:peptide chain release factor H [Paucibacter sp. KBW04]|uniref:peptide chain release factor H n=1 Tax=Paucibacter sp. KBW04 TaxID=2153361 RepID=UPI000F57B8DE|nr:peptide chain release factor H [Paucibacter sp. KBW04]RQO62066.1 peptide chain release factor H [Paucibacter sp. KBW04]